MAEQTEVYYDSVEIRIPLSRATPEPYLLELEISYQGCKKDSICYPPETLLLPVDLPLASQADMMADRPPPVTEQARLAGVVARPTAIGTKVCRRFKPHRD